jgi:hypothetical protein
MVLLRSFVGGFKNVLDKPSSSSLNMVDLDSLSHMHDLGNSILVSLADAWSVTDVGSTSDSAVVAASSGPDVTSNLFAVSLFPYLALLIFLSRRPTNTPPLANFGFQFLLFFVFATIPAGIYAKVHYGETLANVDWLHGLAESLLSVTNLLIIMGFRNVREESTPNPSSEGIDVEKLDFMNIFIPLAIILKFAINPVHAEPVNALSLPTWWVHTSSIIEWLVAMNYIWEHAEVSGNPRWKGMTWAMIPSHASGLCACTYHFFYNSPLLAWMVTTQAALTVVGNTTMAFAAYRIFEFARQEQEQDIKKRTITENTISKESLDSKSLAVSQDDNIVEYISRFVFNRYEPIAEEKDSWFEQIKYKSPVKNAVPLEDTTTNFFLSLCLKTILLAPLVKYGELYLDTPFSQTPALMALTMIIIPILINMNRYMLKSSTMRGGVNTV